MEDRPLRTATPTGEVVHGPGTLLSNRYLLEERIARTVMSSIWRAHDDRLGRAVVAKLMALDLAAQPDARGRFEREARAAAQLSSPHIVTVFDFGESENVPYIVLEALRGQDLQHRLGEAGRLPPATCGWVADQTAAALVVAHEAGVVHRDIKPSNLFICRTPGIDVETLKVLDFGIARLMGESRRTAAGTVVGSPLFMSPEQASGQAVDTRTDLYSLAVVLFRCLTGELPFRGTVAEVLVRVQRDPPRRAGEVAADLGDRFDAFFSRGLAKSPADRFPDARALVTAFREALQPGDVPSTVRVGAAELAFTDAPAPSLLGETLVPGEVRRSPLAAHPEPTVTLVRETTGPRPPAPRTLVSPSPSRTQIAARRDRLVGALPPVAMAEPDLSLASESDAIPTAVGVIPASVAEMARLAATSGEPPPEEEPATSIAAIPPKIGALARAVMAASSSGSSAAGARPEQLAPGTSAAWSPSPDMPVSVPTGPMPVVDSMPGAAGHFLQQAPLLPPLGAIARSVDALPSARAPRKAEPTLALVGPAALAEERAQWVASDPGGVPGARRRWWAVPLTLAILAVLALTAWSALDGSPYMPEALRRPVDP